MELNLFKTLGQIGGIAGISLGVFLLLFRDVIRKNIFPKFKDQQLAYRLLRLIVVLVWSMAIAGIAAWVVISVLDTKPSNVTLISSSEYSGDMYFSNIEVIVSQSENATGETLPPALKIELERAIALVKASSDTSIIITS